MELEAGRVLGGYRVIRRIGQGGMGAVYEVEHAKLGVHYALKALTLDHGRTDLLRTRFLAEGKVLARLNHPGLVRVFNLDVDEATGMPYFVMDLVLYRDGLPHTLADIEDGGVDEPTLVQWFGELVDALSYVHARGIVHRDVKLNNILLAADRHVMLGDFGVSRFFGEDVRRILQLESTTQATDGERLVMGTAHYMAPEVMAGEKATPAADFYSLGIVFYRLLTGMWYEPNETAHGLLADFSFNWDEVLLPLLDEVPARRVLRSLTRRTTTEAVAVAAPRWRGRLLVGIVIGVLCVLAILGVVLAVSRGKISSSGKEPAAVVEPTYDDAFAIPESVK